MYTKTLIKKLTVCRSRISGMPGWLHTEYDLVYPRLLGRSLCFGWGRSIVQKSYLSGQVHFHVHYAPGTSSRALAHMLDSLVRVSRRDDEKHFVRVSPSSNSNGAQTGFHTFLQAGRKPNTLAYINAHKFSLLPIGSFSAISGTL